MAKKFTEDFRRFFLGGLSAVLPTVLTLMIIIYVYNFVQRYIGRHVNKGIRWIIGQVWLTRHPGVTVGQDAFKEWSRSLSEFWSQYLWWVGFVLAIVGIYILGKFVGSYLGRGLWRGIDRMLLRMPVVKQIYPYVKQVTDFMLSDKKKKTQFSSVVAVEYPRKGIWSVGLATGPALSGIINATGADLITIFIPSSPTPITGYTITVRRDEVIELSMSIDEAFRFTVSGGVILPGREKPTKDQLEQAATGELAQQENDQQQGNEGATK